MILQIYTLCKRNLLTSVVKWGFSIVVYTLWIAVLLSDEILDNV